MCRDVKTDLEVLLMHMPDPDMSLVENYKMALHDQPTFVDMGRTAEMFLFKEDALENEQHAILQAVTEVACEIMDCLGNVAVTQTLTEFLYSNSILVGYKKGEEDAACLGIEIAQGWLDKSNANKAFDAAVWTQKIAVNHAEQREKIVQMGMPIAKAFLEEKQILFMEEAIMWQLHNSVKGSAAYKVADQFQKNYVPQRDVIHYLTTMFGHPA